ncbi:unnamed protein product [Gongylonema pulchrum]|uniref:ATP synthase subunit b n=1 Tax=Gongylonema pulchrum TaxID=637853 RepID=A0A183F120_9BILA|nr:unnamed protein product [Gongylonema pulchrum]
MFAKSPLQRALFLHSVGPVVSEERAIITSKAGKIAYAAVKEHYPAVFKETLALQLEATYRRNVELLASEMKRRLDYLLETQAVKRSFARDHMLKWIIEAVTSFFWRFIAR